MATVTKRQWLYKGQAKEAWVVRYVDAKGSQRQETFKLKKQADAARRKIEDGLENGTHISARETVPIAEACEAFIRLQEDRVHEGALQPASLKNIKQAVDISIVPHLGKLRMIDLKPLHVETFYRDLVRRDRLAPMTARGRVGYLKSVCDFGVKRGWAAKNVVPGALDDIGYARRPRIRVFSREDVEALLATAENRAKGAHRRTWQIVRLAVHLAAFCGLRYGEIFGLTLPCLDLTRRFIKVRHSLNAYDVLKGPKTRAGVRDVPVPPHLVEMLRQWIATEYLDNERGLIFRTNIARSVDKAIEVRSFHGCYWRPLLKRAGLGGGDWFHFHALRHFAASNMIASGLPVTDTAAMLGHERFDTTLQVYAHPIVNGTQRAAMVDAMAAALWPASAISLPPETAQASDIDNNPLINNGSRNMVTILAEERLALAIYRPQALIKGNFTGAA